MSEEYLSRAVLALVERAKLVVEPAGAAAVAAILDQPDHFGTPLVAVLSGGNIDPLLLGKVIRHGMAAAGRYLNLHVNIPDTPGGLATMLGRGQRRRGQRARGRARADLAAAAPRRGRGAPAARDARASSTPSRCMSRLREHGYRIFE